MKDRSAATWSSMAEPQKHYVSERSFTHSRTSCMTRFMRFRNKQNYSEKPKTVVASDGMGKGRLGRGRRELSAMPVRNIVVGVWATQVLCIC